MNLPKLFRRFSNRRLHIAHLRNIASVAQADGKIDPSEKDLLGQIVDNYGLRKTTLAQLSNQRPRTPRMPLSNPEQRVRMLYELILMVLADHKVHESELEACRGYARELGFEEDEIPPLIDALQNKPLTKPGEQPQAKRKMHR